ncbi:MAG: universal stress protein [Halobacteriales archaeon]|nr:universal stress protein [Halobacteriales archaeon]
MHVLIPFGLSSSSKRAAHYAVSTFGPRGDLSMTVVHLTEEGKGPSEDAIENTVLEEYDGEYEIDLNVEIRSFDDELSKEMVRRSIRDITEEMEFDTVVMGYEQKSFFDELLNETTAERLLDERGVPVVLVP